MPISILSAYEFHSQGQLDFNFIHNYYSNISKYKTNVDAANIYGLIRLDWRSRPTSAINSDFIVNIRPYASSSRYGMQGMVGEVVWELKHPIGTIKIGESQGTAYLLQTGAGTMAKASGGIAGEVRFWLPIIYANQFLTVPGLPSNQLSYVYNLDDTMVATDLNKFANKITYVTPIIHNFIFGVSYIPDTNYCMHTFHIAKENSKLQNVLQIAMLFNKQIGDLGIKSSLAYENAQAIGSDAKYGFSQDKIDRNNQFINAWEWGINAAYQGVSLGWSTGQWGKFTQHRKLLNASSSSYWTLGLAYAIGPFGSSITYLHSKKAIYMPQKNTLVGVVLGAEYKLKQSMKLYAEVARYNIMSYQPFASEHKANVTALVTGLKLTF